MIPLEGGVPEGSDQLPWWAYVLILVSAVVVAVLVSRRPK